MRFSESLTGAFSKFRFSLFGVDEVKPTPSVSKYVASKGTWWSLQFFLVSFSGATISNMTKNYLFFCRFYRFVHTDQEKYSLVVTICLSSTKNKVLSRDKNRMYIFRPNIWPKGLGWHSFRNSNSSRTRSWIEIVLFVLDYGFDFESIQSCSELYWV